MLVSDRVMLKDYNIVYNSVFNNLFLIQPKLKLKDIEKEVRA